jgi:outer membrane immunogenic protein
LEFNMRTRFILLAAASAAIGFGAQPAFAQDTDHFTGPRVEVNAGYDATHADDGIASTPNTLESLRTGVAVGYDVAIGDTFTIGGELGAGYSATGNVSGSAGTTSYRLTGGYDLDASVRVGARVTDTTLLYVKGGYAHSEFKLRTTVGGTAGNTVTKISDDEGGWRVGAGVEQAFGDHFYAKAEYRYTDYGSDVSRHQALIGLGYRF